MVTLGKFEAEIVESCPVCGKNGDFAGKGPVAHTYEGVMVDIYMCSNCNTAWNSPRMTKKAMEEYYSLGEYATTMEIVRRKRGNFGERRRAMRLMFIIVNMFNIIEPTRCLDVGCSQGHFLERMKDVFFGLETVGYDVFVDPDAVHEVIDDKSKINGEFDFISCIHTLEHTYDPMAELEWMNSLLVLDGTLMIEVPTKRYVLIEHPITFSLDTVPFLMEHIGISSYTTLDVPSLESCIIFARK